MRNTAKDVVVIGAGTIGTMSSYLLSKRGLNVAIVDADAPGSHASGLAFGGLDPLHGMGLPEPLLDFSLHCFTRHQDVARELHGATGIDHHFQTRNRLYLAFDEGDIREYDANLSWMKDASMFDVGWVDGDTARRPGAEGEPCLHRRDVPAGRGLGGRLQPDPGCRPRR